MSRPARRRFEDRAADAVHRGMMLGIVCAIVLTAFVFASGSSFGQRCSRMHPDGDAATMAACVEGVRSGG